MTAFTWTASAGGDWSTPGNWAPEGPPTGNDNAFFFGQAGTITVDVIGVDNAASTILFANFDGKGEETISIDGALTVGTLQYLSGSDADVTVDSGGLLNITTKISAPSNAPETIIISAGTLELGTLSIGTTNSNTTFDLSNVAGGIIDYTSGAGTSADQAITNVAIGDEFVITGQNFTGDTVDNTSSPGMLLVKNAALATVFTMSNVQVGSATGFKIVGEDIIQAVCYARGTMIRTPGGELPVEKLRPGKQVITLVDGEEVPQTVTWLGHRRIDLTTHLRPETVAPIRIERDAIADGMPHRDLLVSPDHAIFVDGKLICARQLINGTTIRRELDWTAVDYYHVELDQHAILLAEGLPAESYIDTGNSGFFANSSAPMVLHPDLTDETDYPTREAGSCEPFVSDETSVQPIWQRVADRAAAIGQPVPQRATTTDAGLRLRTKLAGRHTIEPIYSDSNLVIFVLPSRSQEVRLLSRAQSPTEARPWLEDRRHLGVRVKRVVLRSANELREIPVDHPDLTQGWWAVERDGEMMARWTDGEAVLPLPAMQGTVMLEIHLAGSMTYAVDAASEEGTERRAAA